MSSGRAGRRAKLPSILAFGSGLSPWCARDGGEACEAPSRSVPLI
jgi:hypothetical protein